MLSQPLLRNVETASSISANSAIPVERITGLPVAATYFKRGISVISGEAILYTGVFKDSSKSTEDSSNGEENISISQRLASSNNA